MKVIDEDQAVPVIAEGMIQMLDLVLWAFILEPEVRVVHVLLECRRDYHNLTVETALRGFHYGGRLTEGVA